jgi:cobalt-zinc-cadmium efflux system membrane fusion protein
VASVDNAAGRWRPGSFVTAEIPVDRAQAVLVVPLTALQFIDGVAVVFVRTAEGFEARKVGLGQRDTRVAEITKGLTAGEQVATLNTFTLKAELGKAAAEHQH